MGTCLADGLGSTGGRETGSGYCSGGTNEKDLVDSVKLGKETFTSVGCEACHRVEPASTAVSSGPNLFGLLRPDPRMREVAEGADGRRFQIKAGREYLHRSVRAPARATTGWLRPKTRSAA